MIEKNKKCAHYLKFGKWEAFQIKGSAFELSMNITCIGEPPLSTLSIPSLGAPPPNKALMIFRPKILKKKKNIIVVIFYS